MDQLIESLTFGVAIALMVVGLVGVVVPLIPGILLIWATVLGYALLEEFAAIDAVTFTVITLIALVAGTADLWLPLLGAKTGGASGRAMVLGVVGGLIGFLVGNIIGSILGYALGILLGQYHKHRDWNVALKASLGGLAGIGIATAIQLGGGLLILVIFVWQVLAFQLSAISSQLFR